ncbi:Cytochrome c oxidase assembly protein cox11, mitochondrial [Clonorchis sinensis]|uniref:Cytochrome c oxidase assembly protein COX11, mitochondrial n=2 Tax=Clonorchis sinensis TaxID=79923 RepID=H2KUF4_CLOSI|nr:Cytochrome c oxidase assembly protein cox11, mitochondrial [Clonorchis sinensis]GAA29988.2 cytochrome c oxidase subunit XI assembly protein [Clonorchis sinensis]
MLFHRLIRIASIRGYAPFSSWRSPVNSPVRGQYEKRTRLYYSMALGVAMVGFGYACVPLYRIYCSKVGVGTNSEFARAKTEIIKTMKPVKEREITVHFSADTHSKMAWKFKPVQNELTVVPGETALAFYSAENPTDRPIIGIATYSIVPTEASKYFNKIQCFCFEEQRLNPHEQVDMPVFFFLDPEFAEDPNLQRTDRIILHYTFFESKNNKMATPSISSPNPVTVSA